MCPNENRAVPKKCGVDLWPTTDWPFVISAGSGVVSHWADIRPHEYSKTPGQDPIPHIHWGSRGEYLSKRDWRWRITCLCQWAHSLMGKSILIQSLFDRTPFNLYKTFHTYLSIVEVLRKGLFWPECQNIQEIKVHRVDLFYILDHTIMSSSLKKITSWDWYNWKTCKQVITIL